MTRPTLASQGGIRPARGSLVLPEFAGVPGEKHFRKKHELALWIVGRHALPRDLNEATRSPLFGEMRAVLDDQEYEDFVAATARLSRRPIISVR